MKKHFTIFIIFLLMITSPSWSMVDDVSDFKKTGSSKVQNKVSWNYLDNIELSASGLKSSFLSGAAYSLVPEIFRDFLDRKGYSKFSNSLTTLAQGGLIYFTDSYLPAIAGMSTRLVFNKLGFSPQTSTIAGSTVAVVANVVQHLIFAQETSTNFIVKCTISCVGSCAGSVLALKTKSWIYDRYGIKNKNLPFDEWKNQLLKRKEPWAQHMLQKVSSQSIDKLDFRKCNSLGPEGIKYLSTSNFYNLTLLDLTQCHIRDDGIGSLANCSLSNLKALNLQDNDVRDRGVKLLLNGNLSNLEGLSLSKNSFITSEGGRWLANGNLRNLKLLNLSDTNIKDEGARHLANGKLTNLKILALCGASLNDAGAISLANGNLTNLETLDLRWNGIENEGAQAIANGNLTSLDRLFLGCNNIHDEGAIAVANSLKFILSKLDLGCNDISIKTKLSLWYNKLSFQEIDLTW